MSIRSSLKSNKNSSHNKTRKNVRISSVHHFKKISPSAKEYNRVNNLSKQERIQSLRDAYAHDEEFKQHINTRREAAPLAKEYRKKVLQSIKAHKETMEAIRKTRKHKTPSPHSNSKDKSTIELSKKKRIQPVLLSSTPSTHPINNTPKHSTRKKSPERKNTNIVKKLFSRIFRRL